MIATRVEDAPRALDGVPASAARAAYAHLAKTAARRSS